MLSGPVHETDTVPPAETSTREDAPGDCLSVSDVDAVEGDVEVVSEVGGVRVDVVDGVVVAGVEVAGVDVEVADLVGPGTATGAGPLPWSATTPTAVHATAAVATASTSQAAMPAPVRHHADLSAI